MRTNALPSLLVASAGFGFAGESPKQAIIPAAVIPQSSGCPECLNFSGLFLGAGVDYLFDAESEYYNGRVGYEFANKKGYSQSLFLEVGWMDNDDDYLNGLQAIPVTLNYEYKRALTRCLNFYIGGGVGVAFTDNDSEVLDDKGAPTGEFDSHDDTVFVVQAFAGLTYCVTESVELYGGVRYLWSDDIGDGEGIDDWSIGAGLRVKF
ncbi:MAG: outer membrane protein [Roseibacillus sp.]